MSIEGRLSIGGREVATGRRNPQQAGIVFQNPAGMFDPLSRIGDQLVEAVVYHGRMNRYEARRKAAEVLASVGFANPGEITRLYPHQLSGGMAQRAAIAMALMPDPRLLVVDEPTSALDANLRTEILTLLRGLARQRRSAVLLVSHDLALVGRFCDSVDVMYAGRIVEYGPTAAVLQAPDHPYTRALTATAPTMSSPPRTPLPTIPGAPPTPGSWPTGCVFEPRCPLSFERCRLVRPAQNMAQDRGAACHLLEDGTR
jgi:oligopeptide/dipeptide ABC transporter ATP-binding protein